MKIAYLDNEILTKWPIDNYINLHYLIYQIISNLIVEPYILRSPIKYRSKID